MDFQKLIGPIVDICERCAARSFRSALPQRIVRIALYCPRARVCDCRQPIELVIGVSVGIQRAGNQFVVSLSVADEIVSVVVRADDRASAVASEELRKSVVGIIAVLGIDPVWEPLLREPTAVIVNKARQMIVRRPNAGEPPYRIVLVVGPIAVAVLHGEASPRRAQGVGDRLVATAVVYALDPMGVIIGTHKIRMFPFSP